MRSHIYELHAILSATIAFLLMFPIKRPIKGLVKNFVEKKVKTNEKWEKNQRDYHRRCNMVVLIAALALSFLSFCVISVVSPLINFSIMSGFLSGAVTLTEYAIYDQFLGK